MEILCVLMLARAAAAGNQAMRKMSEYSGFVYFTSKNEKSMISHVRMASCMRYTI